MIWFASKTYMYMYFVCQNVSVTIKTFSININMKSHFDRWLVLLFNMVLAINVLSIDLTVKFDWSVKSNKIFSSAGTASVLYCLWVVCSTNECISGNSATGEITSQAMNVYDSLYSLVAIDHIANISAWSEHGKVPTKSPQSEINYLQTEEVALGQNLGSLYYNQYTNEWSRHFWIDW